MDDMDNLINPIKIVINAQHLQNYYYLSPVSDLYSEVVSCFNAHWKTVHTHTLAAIPYITAGYGNTHSIQWENHLNGFA